MADNNPNPDSADDEDVMQKLERSLDFWVSGKEDYPPAIRGVMSELSDHSPEIQALIRRIGSDKEYPDLVLKRLLWLEDKNDKLDDACEEAKRAFLPFAVNADGLISLSNASNPLLDKPTRHRLVVNDRFALENYRESNSGDMITDEESKDSVIDKKSWKRKITQTLKPWAVKRGDKIVYVRPEGELLTTLNMLFSRTYHGWLVVDLYKLRHRRGAMLTYARTFENQRRQERNYEFKIEYFGAAAEYRNRLADALSNIAGLYFEIRDGEIYVTKASAYPEAIRPPRGEADPYWMTIPLQARVVLEEGKPSQLVLKKTGPFYDAELRPILQQCPAGQTVARKLDLRKLSSDEKDKRIRVDLRVELDGPVLVASSGEGYVFQLSDIRKRFASSSAGAGS